MHRIGSLMWFHPTLDEQVAAYANLLAGQPCTVDPENCPVDTTDPGLNGGQFRLNACRSN